MHFSAQEVFDYAGQFDRVRKDIDHESYSFIDARAKYGFLWRILSEFLRPGYRVLELGGGDLHFTRIVARENPSVNIHSVDLVRPRRIWARPPRLRAQPKLLLRTWIHAVAPRPSNISLHLENSLKFLAGLPAESFDIVYDACSLTHFDITRIQMGDASANQGVLAGIEQVHRVLKPEGQFFSATDLSPAEPSESSSICEFLTSPTWLAALNGRGFFVATSSTTDPAWLYPPGGYGFSNRLLSIGGVRARKEILT